MCSCEIHKRLYLRNCHVSSLSSYDGCTTWNIQTLWPPAEFWRRSSCACMAHRVKKITSQTFLPAIWVCVPCPSIMLGKVQFDMCFLDWPGMLLTMEISPCTLSSSENSRGVISSETETREKKKFGATRGEWPVAVQLVAIQKLGLTTKNWGFGCKDSSSKNDRVFVAPTTL